MAGVADTDADALFGVHRSATGRRWRRVDSDDRVARAVAQKAGVPDTLAQILVARGIGADDVVPFLNPTLRDLLPDPSRLKDMDVAAARLAKAVQDSETIAIFGDYDVDGATSAAVLIRYLRQLGHDARLYVPDRQKEGYGPNTKALLKLKEQGATLAVTVDCGITSFEPLTAAQQAGLDVVVVDHHQAQAGLPPAVAIVNPNRLDEDPHLTDQCGMLAAVGVTFLLAIATNRHLRDAGYFTADRLEPDLLQLLDIVALGTVADVVPLVGLNRAFVNQGLKVMAQRRNVGLSALADVARMDSAPTPYHLGFVLGPRINAGGRVGQSDLGGRLLLCDDPGEARGMAMRLEDFNRDRKDIEARVQLDAMSQAESQGNAPCVVVASGDWHGGVIGIVAGRLREAFHRPAFVLAIEGDVAKGSGRSVRGVDLGAVVTAARQKGLLINGGGHKMAAGLTVATDQIAALQNFLVTEIGRRMDEAPAATDMMVDAVLGGVGGVRDLALSLEQAGPYGAGFPEPRLAISGLRLVDLKIVGDGHFRCMFADHMEHRLGAMAFRAGDTELGACLQAAYSGGQALHVAGQLRVDRWMGRELARLFVEDVAPVN